MINVRRGQKDDFVEVGQLLDRVWGEDDYVHHLWPEWVEKPEEGVVLVAEHEGQIVGTSYVHFMPHSTCWFQALRVHPDQRRLGVGSALTQASLREARVGGQHMAYLGIDADNTASLTMTARAGFSKISEYARLVKQLPASAKEVVYPVPWRRALVSDDDAILELGDREGRKEFVVCWQWQPFSREAILGSTTDNHLWVWDEGHLKMWSGFEDFEAHPHLFDPCGSPEDVKDVIARMTQFLAREEEATFEVWLHHTDPLVTYLIEQLSFVQEDGYTIWGFKL